MAKVIQDCKAIIVDEAPMTHKSVFEAPDRSLRDIIGVQKIFGGIPTLLCGDFRQILPVVKNGTRANIVNASLKTSYLWNNVIIKKLTTNMRAHLSDNTGGDEFAKLLIDIGDGKFPLTTPPDVITIPQELEECVQSLEDLKAKVYPNLTTNATSQEWLGERAIISPLNSSVNQLNIWLMSEFPGEGREYKSIDTAINDGEAVQYPVEFLNSLELAGLPPHKLTLKPGCPIMFLRSLEPPKTMNGTRCIVTRLHENVIEAMISTGPFKNETVILPRIPLVPSDSEIPFQFRRLQFPVKPCFAFTINKAQGQTLKAIGIDLSSACFTHGMFYVSVSRIKNGK